MVEFDRLIILCRFICFALQSASSWGWLCRLVSLRFLFWYLDWARTRDICHRCSWLWTWFVSWLLIDLFLILNFLFALLFLVNLLVLSFLTLILLFIRAGGGWAAAYLMRGYNVFYITWWNTLPPQMLIFVRMCLSTVVIGPLTFTRLLELHLILWIIAWWDRGALRFEVTVFCFLDSGLLLLTLKLLLQTAALWSWIPLCRLWHTLYLNLIQFK